MRSFIFTEKERETNKILEDRRNDGIPRGCACVHILILVFGLMPHDLRVSFGNIWFDFYECDVYRVDFDKKTAQKIYMVDPIHGIY
jgi:hypothetical protein